MGHPSLDAVFRSELDPCRDSALTGVLHSENSFALTADAKTAALAAADASQPSRQPTCPLELVLIRGLPHWLIQALGPIPMRQLRIARSACVRRPLNPHYFAGHCVETGHRALFS